MPVSKAPLNFYEYKEEAHSINFKVESDLAYPSWVYKYFSYYQLDFEIPHYFGTLKAGNYQIVTQYFEPLESKKTIMLVHGYLEHTANFNLLIRRLLNENYAVLTIDMPGHGLSSGVDSSIESFTEYGDILDSIVGQLKSDVKPFYALLGHSTGGAAVIEYLRSYESGFEVHILAAPLVRSDLWDLSKFSFNLLGGLIKTLPALIREISHDKEYLNFLRYHDPLQRKTAAIDWVRALFEWDKILVNTSLITEKPVYIFQGKSDAVVFWKYNMKYLEQRMPNSKIFYFDKAKHDIFHESEPISRPIINALINILKSPE